MFTCVPWPIAPKTVVFCLAAVLGGCASPSERAIDQALDQGFSEQRLRGNPFDHFALTRLKFRPSGALHVYIEHDGRPWTGNRWVSADPTPRNPVMLELMRLDSQSVLYLGRPCYFGLRSFAACTPLLWTHERYSAQVVESMVVALRGFVEEHGTKTLALLGHSGGATLAVLIAERMPEVAAVVTIAGNLDIDQWAEIHQYSALAGSLNPLDRPPLRADLIQLHYVGLADKNTPPELIRRFVSRQSNTRLIEIPGFDHTCCWARIWPAILQQVRRQVAERGSASGSDQ